VIPTLGPNGNLLRNAMANDASSMKTKIQNIVLRYAELGGYNTPYAKLLRKKNGFILRGGYGIYLTLSQFFRFLYPI